LNDPGPAAADGKALTITVDELQTAGVAAEQI
jgi:hypothetical protein